MESPSQYLEMAKPSIPFLATRLDPSKLSPDWVEWHPHSPSIDGPHLTLPAFIFWAVDMKAYDLELRLIYASGLAMSKAYVDETGCRRRVLPRPPFKPDEPAGKAMQRLCLLRFTCVALVLTKRRDKPGREVFKIVGVTGKLPLTYEWWEKTLRSELEQVLILE